TWNARNCLNPSVESGVLVPSTRTVVGTTTLNVPAASRPIGVDSVSGAQRSSAHTGVHSKTACSPSAGPGPKLTRCTHGGQPFVTSCSVTSSPAHGCSGTTRSDTNVWTSESGAGGGGGGGLPQSGCTA